MSSTMTTRRFPTPRLGGTIARWAPVAVVLMVVLAAGIALVRPEPTSVDGVIRSAAYTDHPAVLHGDVAAAAVAAQHARRPHPTVDLAFRQIFGQHLVEAVGPVVSPTCGGTSPPDVMNTIRHDRVMDAISHDSDIPRTRQHNP